ncbi:hypothetical protein EX30DRAFT_177141 [Ascodesmis nigricans]|uniref:Uncharacterized protein n=1 Tax=Ascodesmis nigricans TaxID=341454 RepID=A0A4V3SHW4_9PEZI|nr:hypothetical protein EX30DRAFT_177141 [Ascodesmis nigricans]
MGLYREESSPPCSRTKEFFSSMIFIDFCAHDWFVWKARFCLMLTLLGLFPGGETGRIYHVLLLHVEMWRSVVWRCGF